MGTIIALILLIVVGYLIIVELGFPLTDIVDIISYKLSGLTSSSSLTVIAVIIGVIMAYFLFIREEK